jgi:hypothetical protein
MSMGVAAGSPIIGMMFPTLAMRLLGSPEWRMLVAWLSLWIVVYAGLATLLYWATVMTFDRCMDRMPETPEREIRQVARTHAREVFEDPLWQTEDHVRIL